MGRPRLVDYDKVRRLYATGEFTYRTLAEHLGVSLGPINYALNERVREYKREYQERTKVLCAGGCGRLVHRLYGGERLCRSCWADQIRTTVQPQALRCGVCKTWKADDEFPRSRAEPQRRGRHVVCRACGTVERQKARIKRSVPCANCGKPRLHPNDARGRNFTGLCLDCYRETPRNVPRGANGRFV